MQIVRAQLNIAVRAANADNFTGAAAYIKRDALPYLNFAVWKFEGRDKTLARWAFQRLDHATKLLTKTPLTETHISAAADDMNVAVRHIDKLPFVPFNPRW